MTARSQDARSQEAAWDARIAAAGDPAEGCPSPEEWHRAALGELPAEALDRLARHAAGCPACAAERDLARAFAAGPDPAEAAATAADVTAIVARLEARPPHRAPRSAPSAAGGAPAPSAAGGAPTPAAGAGAAPAAPAGRLLRFPWRFSGAPALFAVAAALVLALGLAYQAGRGAGPPELPDRREESRVRGGAIDDLAPAGELDAPPGAFTWEPVAGAARYRLTLFAVDDRVLWEGEAAAPPAPLPAAVMPLSSAVTYGWRVEALDREDRVIARSERAQFLIRPAAEAPAED